MMNPMQLMQSISSMMQGGGNPQMLAQQIMQKNPQFAQAIQGQNPQVLAQSMMQRMGMSPQQIQQMVSSIQNGGMPGGIPGGFNKR